MPRLDITCCALLGMVLGSVSCATPKAILVPGGAPVAKVEKMPVKPEEPVAPIPDPPLADLPDNSIRMPNFLDLPSDGDFRATHPGEGKAVSSTGTVVSRPPTDPPSRVKPKATDKE